MARISPKPISSKTTLPSPADSQPSSDIKHIPRLDHFSGPLTKNGKPDRRFRGQRDLEENINPDYVKPSTGEVDDEGNHLTKDGKPDRRYLENRRLSDEEAKIKMAEMILASRKQKA